MDFKLILSIMCFLCVFFSCEKKDTTKNNIISKREFIMEYRQVFFLSYLYTATDRKIAKTLDSLNDWSFQGDGGNIPAKYSNHADSIATLCIKNADKVVFNPGEKPRTYLIPELARITQGNFIDSMAIIAYKDYVKWHEKAKSKIKH